MHQFEIDEITRGLSEQKGLLIGLSRGLDRLAGRRGGAKRERAPGELPTRLAVVTLLQKSEGTPRGKVFVESPQESAARHYPADNELRDIVTRAATPPATTTTPTYAAELVATSVIDFLGSGTTPSGFAALAARSLTVDVTGSAKVPARQHPAAPAGGWIGEGSAKPVFAIGLASITLTPSKLAALSAWSEEVGQWSVPSIEAVVREALTHDLNALLDSAAFDSSAATAVRPAGLFASATSVSPATPGAGMTRNEAMVSDLQALHAAIATGAPDADVLYVVNPAQALRLRPAVGDDKVISTGFITPGVVGALDLGAVATMLGEITFTASRDASVHLSNPAEALAASGATAISAPVVSLFQSDLIGLRSVLKAAWKTRRSGAAALATGVSW